MSNDRLSRKIASFEQELQEMGCIGANFPPPNLRNDIHPIFQLDRWMRGYGQEHTAKYYARMKPAFRLASLFITEDCMLWWFAHIHFGNEAVMNSGDGRRIRYIEAVPEQFSGLPIVRQTFNDMAKVVAFHFVPEPYKDTQGSEAYGCTTCSNNPRFWPWYSRFNSGDFPPIQSGWPSDLCPKIFINFRFLEFYGKRYSKSSEGQRLRVHFMLAATIVHELAHAYYMFIGKPQRRVEPHWAGDEPGEPELGFAWEMCTLGRIVNPLYNNLLLNHTLYGIETYRWSPGEELKENYATHAIDTFLSGEGALTQLGIPVDYSILPRDMQETEWRGAAYMGYDVYSTTQNVRFLAHGIPMKWIAGWFQEEDWDERRRYFARHPQRYEHGWRYMEPKLGPTFSLVYESLLGGEPNMWVVSRRGAGW